MDIQKHVRLARCFAEIKIMPPGFTPELLFGIIIGKIIRRIHYEIDS